MRVISFLFFILISNTYSNISFGVTVTPSAIDQSIRSNSPSPLNSKLLGAFEVRPSYRSQIGEFHSEDSAFLGYQFNSNDSAVYKQEFNTNMYDPRMSQNQSGLNAYLVDGYFKEKANNLISGGGFSLSYEARQYLPTWSVRRDAGMITYIRNYAKLKYQATSRLVLTAEEVPVVHLYKQAGSVTGKGPWANPIFENRSSIGFEYAFSDSLKLMVPLLLSDVRTRDYDSAAPNNAKWVHKLWFNPEVYYSLNSNLTVGMGFYSENLIKNNEFAETAVGAGLEQGTTQLIFSANL